MYSAIPTLRPRCTAAGTLTSTVAVFVSADPTLPVLDCTNSTGAGWVTVRVKETLAVGASFLLTIKHLVVPSGAVGRAYARSYLDSKCEVEELTDEPQYYEFDVAP